ncbi:MAG: hypothetical protein ABS79_06955 [Planctomycetes bacterium SCN 63-9]|nr:MAG: hypothetical protein ABS79_06955 [Planctomycetes bacterium SCN 63-9]
MSNALAARGLVMSSRARAWNSSIDLSLSARSSERLRSSNVCRRRFLPRMLSPDSASPNLTRKSGADGAPITANGS